MFVHNSPAWLPAYFLFYVQECQYMTNYVFLYVLKYHHVQLLIYSLYSAFKVIFYFSLLQTDNVMSVKNGQVIVKPFQSSPRGWERFLGAGRKGEGAGSRDPLPPLQRFEILSCPIVHCFSLLYFSLLQPNNVMVMPVQNAKVIVKPLLTSPNQTTQYRQRTYNISGWMADRYKPPLASETANGTVGDFFSIVPPPYPRNFINITEYDLTNFTFVTSSSSNHFKESLDMVAGVQHHFPDKKLIYYDLGLKPGQRKKVCTFVFSG